MERDYKIDNLRAIAILLVVLGHSIIIYDPNWGLISTNVECQQFMYLKKMINLIQMPLFFSISGYCFCLSRKQTFNKTMFTNKLRRIMIPYFVVCFLYMDPIKILLNVPGYDLSLSLLGKQLVLFVDNGHLWYLPSLFLMFMATSIALWGGMKRWVLFGMAIVCAIFFNRSPCLFSLPQFCLYYVYFMLGYLICFYKGKWKENRFIGLFLCLIPLALSLFVNDGGLVKRCFCILMAFSVVIGFYELMPSVQNKLLARLSKDSYGIYLFHSPLIYFMYMQFPDANPLLMLGVNFFLCGSISLGVVYVIRKIGLKFIIGEK